MVYAGLLAGALGALFVAIGVSWASHAVPPVNLLQRDGLGINIPAGGTVTGTTVQLTASSDTPTCDAGATYWLEFELRQVGQAFTGVPTHASPSMVGKPSCVVVQYPWTTISGLAGGFYKWQVRERTNVGAPTISSWVQFNAGNTAFVIVNFSAGPNMAGARTGHTATLLTDGDVLIAGGGGSTQGEIFSIATGAVTSTGTLSPSRTAHTATLIASGGVFLAGGSDGANSLSSTARFDPSTGAFTAGPSLNSAREAHTATLLYDGTVLLAAGVRDFSTYLATAEIYDPRTGTVTYTTGGLPSGRNFHTATLLGDGSVLVAGGFNGTSSLNGAALYNPVGKVFTVTGSLTTERRGHTATLLMNGNVLVAGGRSNAGTI
ncbi:MAG: hypothetical protein HYZ28_24280, partial [Myxococcales bacterium]|nr:hypothetical protein [Myxococcales bacterium]